MRHPARSIIALTLMATTLCAARVFASPAIDRAQQRSSTEPLVVRLTRNLGRTIGQRPLCATRQPAASVQAPVSVAVAQPVRSVHLSPFQYRLPPPLL